MSYLKKLSELKNDDKIESSDLYKLMVESCPGLIFDGAPHILTEDCPFKATNGDEDMFIYCVTCWLQPYRKEDIATSIINDVLEGLK